MAVGGHGLRWGGVGWASVGQAETFSEALDLGQFAVTRDTDSSGILVLASPGKVMVPLSCYISSGLSPDPEVRVFSVEHYIRSGRVCQLYCF